MRLSKRTIAIFILLSVNMLAGLILSWDMVSGGKFFGEMTTETKALLVGVSMVCGSVLLFVIIGLFYRLRHKTDKDISVYTEQIGLLTKDLQLSKDEIRERDMNLVSFRKQLNDVNNLNVIYEKMIKSLRSVISNDSTKIKESYQLLEEAKAKALKAEKLKASFLANINHEIRTPINGILGFSSFLMSPTLTPERRRQYCEVLSNSTSRFLDTLNDIIYYSQIQAGDIDVTISTFNINLLISNVINLAQNYIANQQKNLTVSCKVDLTEKTYIRGFENGYFKILSNFVNNAVKFTQNGGVEIEYTISGNIIKLVVSDTGIGLESSRKDSIFDSFTQDELSLSRHYEGSGLGLSICKGLANLMNGTIGVDSHRNIGSKFWVELPILAEDSKELDIFNAIEEHIKHEPFAGKVLVVTDEDNDYKLIAEFFKSYNITSLQAHDKDDMSEILGSDGGGFQITIVDMQYSVLESLHCAQRILDTKPDMRFAFIANSELSDAERQKLSPFSDHIISKPVTSLSLSKVMNN